MVKDILTKLSPTDRARLQYAFENESSDYIELPGLRFIGVNAQYITFLVIEDEAGAWSVGKINK